MEILQVVVRPSSAGPSRSEPPEIRCARGDDGSRGGRRRTGASGKAASATIRHDRAGADKCRPQHSQYPAGATQACRHRCAAGSAPARSTERAGEYRCRSAGVPPRRAAGAQSHARHTTRAEATVSPHRRRASSTRERGSCIAGPEKQITDRYMTASLRRARSRDHAAICTPMRPVGVTPRTAKAVRN